VRNLKTQTKLANQQDHNRYEEGRNCGYGGCSSVFLIAGALRPHNGQQSRPITWLIAGNNVALEYRWASSQNSRPLEVATELDAGRRSLRRPAENVAQSPHELKAVASDPLMWINAGTLVFGARWLS
jgi:hypothetical protein